MEAVPVPVGTSQVKYSLVQEDNLGVEVGKGPGLEVFQIFTGQVQGGECLGVNKFISIYTHQETNPYFGGLH